MEEIGYYGVNLEVLRGQFRYDPVPAEDNSGNLFIKVTINAECIFNPAATAYNAEGIATPGSFPGLTTLGIQQLLQTPYQRLVVVAGGSTIIDTQGVLDAFNGPMPGRITVTEMIGVRTWHVHFEITTHQPYTPVGVDQDKESAAANFAIVSNRWSVILDIDADTQLSVRRIEGIVKFRTDLLEKQNIFPDELRYLFASHTAPKNFRRSEVIVHALSDGASIHYQVTDEEQYVNLGGESLATKIEGAYTGWFQRGSYDHIPGPRAETTKELDDPSKWNAFKRGLGIGASRLGGGAAAMFGMGLGELPKYSAHCHVNIWGNRLAKKTDLVSLGLAVCFNRCGALAAFQITMSQITVTQSLHSNYVEVDLLHTWGDDSAALATTVGLNPGPPIPVALMPTGAGGVAATPGYAGFLARLTLLPDITNPAGGGTILTNANGSNPLLFANGGTAGTYLESLMTQILWNPGQLVPDPP